ncbi:hypothetical protein DYB36_006606 [Aphanomyces astaci]|nr:hypothetical protein DYB36_006606 [Aphanomyces astaci]
MSTQETLGGCSLDVPMDMSVENCFFFPQAPARVVFSIGSHDTAVESLSLALHHGAMPSAHANVASISVISHLGTELELQGHVDGSLHLLHYQDRRVLLRYDLSKNTDPITQVSLHIAESRLEIVVLLRSGKLLSVEGLCVDDVLLQSPPVPMSTLFSKVRLRVGAVGPCHNDQPSLVLDHTQSIGDGLTLFVDANPSHRHEQAIVSHSAFPLLQQLHVGNTGDVVVAVSRHSIAWCGPRELVAPVSIKACGSFPYTSAFLFSDGVDGLVVGAFTRRNAAVFRINVAPDHDLPCPSTAAAADGFHATTSSTTAALDDLFQRAQQDHPRLSSISRDEFQTTLWAALDANPDLVTPCLAQTFPQTKYLDWLMQDLSEWTPDDAAVSAQHARWISFQLMSNSTEFSAPLWHEFRTANLVTILHLLLSQGAMGRLQILWRRHVCLQLVDAFSVQSLPLDVPAATVTHWIRHEVLPVHQYFNVPVDKLALGIVERAKVMATEGDIEGALLWTTVVCPQLLPPERLWKQSKAHEHDPARQVHIQLQQLVYLASVPGLAMAMLDRVQVADMLPTELTNHVEPFLAITSKSALDDILVDYVMEKAAEIPV